MPPRRNSIIKTKKHGVITFDGGDNPSSPNTKSPQRLQRDQDRGTGEDDDDVEDEKVEKAAKPALFTVQEAAAYLHCSRSLLDKLRKRGGGPRFINLGGDLIRYARVDLDGYIANRTFRITAQVSVAE